MIFLILMIIIKMKKNIKIIQKTKITKNNQNHEKIVKITEKSSHFLEGMTAKSYKAVMLYCTALEIDFGYSSLENTRESALFFSENIR